jgi:hypothetical protein
MSGMYFDPADMGGIDDLVDSSIDEASHVKFFDDPDYMRIEEVDHGIPPSVSISLVGEDDRDYILFRRIVSAQTKAWMWILLDVDDDIELPYMPGNVTFYKEV